MRKIKSVRGEIVNPKKKLNIYLTILYTEP